MDFHLSKEHEMLRKMYREFAQNEVKPLAEEVDETERFPQETVEKLIDYVMNIENVEDMASFGDLLK